MIQMPVHQQIEELQAASAKSGDVTLPHPLLSTPLAATDKRKSSKAHCQFYK